MGKIQKRQHRNGQHFQAHPKTQSYIPIQETSVPRPVHGPGRPRGKGTVIPSGSSRPPVRSVPGDR